MAKLANQVLIRTLLLLFTPVIAQATIGSEGPGPRNRV